MPPVSFTSEEANALLLMESLVQGFADRSISTHYTSALSKIKAVLRTKQKEGLERLDQNIKLQLPSCFVNDTDYLSLLQSAISGKTIVELEYKNTKSEVSHRQVEPIGLVFYAFSWHLIAWCHMRHDYRDFKLVRILKVKSTGQSFTQKDHLPLADYMKQLPVAY